MRFRFPGGGRWLAVLVLVLQCSPAVQADEKGFVSLFDGTSLDGWVQHGGVAKYTIENDEIVGTSVAKTPNSFLCTDRPYSDFILELEFKVDPKLNSGIQIRSNVYDEDRVYEFDDGEGNTKSRKVSAGRVHGYQVEIDPSERAWSGGIYDEGRRGWLFDLKDPALAEARAAFKQGEWNHFRIEAIGPFLKTWLNGVPVADLTDEMTPSGFIALQVHGIGDSQEKLGTQIRWRNIRIKDLSKQTSLTFPGAAGPGQGKRVVLISGDEEYRSEQALPQLAQILSKHHGFDCTVLFSIDPETGFVNPNVHDNVPGLDSLEQADVLVLFTRFRKLPDEQMQAIEGYLLSGRPVLGIRTATHAFHHPPDSRWAHYANNYSGNEAAWEGGFGRLVLGECWYTHHGRHKHESTRGVIAPGGQNHPVTRGIQDGDIWGASDVYGVRLPLPGDALPLVLGQVVLRAGEYDADDLFFGMRPSDSQLAGPEKNDPLMPIAWLKSYQLPNGAPGQAMTSTIGAASDLLNEGVRRLLVQGVFFLAGLEDQIPETGVSVECVGEYAPSQYGFRDRAYWTAQALTVDQLVQHVESSQR